MLFCVIPIHSTGQTILSKRQPLELIDLQWFMYSVLLNKITILFCNV